MWHDLSDLHRHVTMWHDLHRHDICRHVTMWPDLSDLHRHVTKWHDLHRHVTV